MSAEIAAIAPWSVDGAFDAALRQALESVLAAHCAALQILEAELQEKQRENTVLKERLREAEPPDVIVQSLDPLPAKIVTPRHEGAEMQQDANPVDNRRVSEVADAADIALEPRMLEVKGSRPVHGHSQMHPSRPGSAALAAEAAVACSGHSQSSVAPAGAAGHVENVTTLSLDLDEGHLHGHTLEAQPSWSAAVDAVPAAATSSSVAVAVPQGIPSAAVSAATATVIPVGPEKVEEPDLDALLAVFLDHHGWQHLEVLQVDGDIWTVSGSRFQLDVQPTVEGEAPHVVASDGRGGWEPFEDAIRRRRLQKVVRTSSTPTTHEFETQPVEDMEDSWDYGGGKDLRSGEDAAWEMNHSNGHIRGEAVPDRYAEDVIARQVPGPMGMSDAARSSKRPIAPPPFAAEHGGMPSPGSSASVPSWSGGQGGPRGGSDFRGTGRPAPLLQTEPWTPGMDRAMARTGYPSAMSMGGNSIARGPPQGSRAALPMPSRAGAGYMAFARRV